MKERYFINQQTGIARTGTDGPREGEIEKPWAHDEPLIERTVEELPAHIEDDEAEEE